MGQVVILYIASVVYSAIRYIAFAPKNIEHLPVFIVNKGVSMGAAFCFVLAFLIQWRRWRTGAGPRVWFRGGIFGVCLHIPMSLAILRPEYFKEFFLESGRLSFGGEAVFLFGALTAGGIYLLTRQDWTPAHRWALSLATMVVLFLHTLFMGIARGLNINASHAYMPPMWLFSLVGIGLGLAFVLLDRPARKVPPADGPGAPT